MKLIYKIALPLIVAYFICLSFIRYYNLPLDGDLPAIVLPVESYELVLKDPFGLTVLLNDSVYAATNRFFTHFFIKSYFRTAPLVLQNISAPLDSLYYSCALFKTIVHFFIIYLFAVLITNRRKIWNANILLVTCLLIPLFQTYGYYLYMGIMDSSITYSFFYAFSFSLVILFLVPFFNAAFSRTSYNFSFLKLIMLIILIIINSFSGPLNSPVLLLICSSTLLYFFIKNFAELTSTPFFKRVIFSVKNIPVTLTSMFLLTILACLYSYFIGRNNAENFYVSIPLAERYARLPEGLINQYTYKLGQPLLIGMIIVNFIIIAMSNPSGEAKKMFVFLKWFFAISIFYILLLPLGGFRPYRPNIIRYDTIMPITLASVFLYGYSTYYILMNLKTKSKKVIYAFVILIFSAIYINADFGFGVKKYSLCERESLEKFVASPDSVVFIDTDCSILNWGKTLNPDDSRGRAELLLHWNIIKNKKLYYQK